MKIYNTSIKYFYESDFLNGNLHYTRPDTALSLLDRVNPALDNHYNFLGIPGTAASPQILSFSPPLFSQTFVRSYDIQLLKSNDIGYYRTNKRFTRLRYHTGAFKEQSIRVFHTQNITKNWNAGLLFERQGVKDFMNFSRTFRSRFGLFTWYASPNDKYNLFAHVVWNSIRNGVNGGLANDSLFDNTNVTNLGIKGLAYRISDAEEHVRNKSFSLSQYYELKKSRSDSDTSTTSNFHFRLHHSIKYMRKSFVYKDNGADSSFYNNFFYRKDSYDSLWSDEINNRFDLQLLNAIYPTGNKFNAGIYAGYNFADYKQRSDSSVINVHRILDDAAAGGYFNFQDTLVGIIRGSYDFVVSGYDKNNFILNAGIESKSFSFGGIGGNISVSQSSPDLIYIRYFGNNFKWDNYFSPLKTIHSSIYYILKKNNFRLQWDYFTINNYVYSNIDAKPAQFPDYIKISQFFITKNFILGSFHFDNKLVNQYTNREYVIHLPAWVTEHSVYFQKYHFKNALLASYGLSLNFNSKYYADAFMPSTGLFYYQSEKKTGGYPRIDVFINAQIKTARVFLKFENVMDDVFKRSYYLTPHYPMPGRVLKFGVVWDFYDQ